MLGIFYGICTFTSSVGTFIAFATVTSVCEIQVDTVRVGTTDPWCGCALIQVLGTAAPRVALGAGRAPGGRVADSVTVQAAADILALRAPV